MIDYPRQCPQCRPSNRPLIGGCILTSSSALKGRNILVAEDSDDMWTLTEIYLKMAGASADRAVNGSQVLEKTSAKSYSAILMDVQMPVMDGLEATRILRRRGFTNPIIAFTTNASKPHESESLSAGCNAHITKPQSASTLVDRLADICDAADSSAALQNENDS